MGVYLNPANSKFFVQFRLHQKLYKKHLPKEISREEAEAFEKQWRSTILEQRILDGYDFKIGEVTLNNRTRNKGVIYIVRVGDLYKIGFTRNFRNRITNLRSHNPNGLEILLVFSVGNPELVERMLHRLFKSKRWSGEWFHLAEEDMEFLKCLSGLRVRFKQI